MSFADVVREAFEGSGGMGMQPDETPARTVRAKFVCSQVTRFAHPGNVQVALHPVMDSRTPENKSFWDATPNGELKMTITNPAASEQFVPGKAYYLDFTPAE
jgi:hypothetical protein